MAATSLALAESRGTDGIGLSEGSLKSTQPLNRCMTADAPECSNGGGALGVLLACLMELVLGPCDRGLEG